MALFTKLFERSNDPYSIPGARWYRARISNECEILKSDIPITYSYASSAKYFTLPVGYSILDLKVRYDGTTSNTLSLTMSIRFNTDGTQGFTTTLWPERFAPYFDVYILAVKNPGGEEPA